MLRILIKLAALCLLLPAVCLGETYLDFEEFPVTTGSVPGDSTNWEYSSNTTNNYPANVESNTSGWKTKSYLSDGYNWFYRVQSFQGDGCDDHYGLKTFGYLTISSNGYTGNALQYTVTGGLRDGNCSTLYGTELYCREQYSGPEDVYTSGEIGHPYIYFKKLNSTLTARNTSAFSQITDKNRWSVYVYLPSGYDNGAGGSSPVGASAVSKTSQVGIFRDPASTAYHHYFNFCTQGGGWAKFQIEETTNGDNATDGSTRYIPNLLTSTWQFYITTLPYAGNATPPYNVLYDNLSFDSDAYANQNNETISNIAIMYNGSGGWEISLNDKYKDATTVRSYATYELRYSLSGAITNENWNSATPAQITADSRFRILARTDGKFQKWVTYSQFVWAPFTLEVEDTAALTGGSTVYFAVKDISQNPADLTDPVDGINGYWATSQGGRDYVAQSAYFDYANDEAALPLIKRISYTIAGVGIRRMSGSGAVIRGGSYR